MRDAIKNLFEAFSVAATGAALALAEGVGGWIEDNVITGHINLFHDEKAPKWLFWNKTGPEMGKVKAALKKEMEAHEYVSSNNIDLDLRGNRLHSVRTNGAEMTDRIKKVLGGATRGLAAVNGYRSLRVLENVFGETMNSFVFQSLVMSGNCFLKEERGVEATAYALGYDAVFTGNIAHARDAVIEYLVRNGRMKEAANLLSFA